MSSTFSSLTGFRKPPLRTPIAALGLFCLLAAGVLSPPPACAAASGFQGVFHDLKVRLDPGSNSITATDHVTFPGTAPGPDVVRFRLHKGMSPRLEDGEGVLSKDYDDNYSSRYAIDLPAGVTDITIRYDGVINHPLQAVGEEYARGQQATVGTISAEGVFLSSNSLWYPVFEGAETFVLHVDVPGGWDAVSQGRRTARSSEGGRRLVTWEERDPQQEIYLVAGPYHEYLSKEGNLTAMVFLREEDSALANRYLEVTHQYVRMFSDLLGPYPYDKFALVENFWETGYGMPSFTLLGPRVIRFPFILHSSYPHEILHNWWGNGVYIDYGGGNWGEGLTAYLADHLIKEQRGDALLHRRTTLQKYADYVLKERDLPLTDFRSRHGSVSEAVGYGKTLMFFHMLRGLLGDDVFTEGLRLFFREHLFDMAGYDDLRRAFEASSGRKLGDFFSQWIGRAGAPKIALEEAEIFSRDGETFLEGRLRQVQKEPPFPLAIPLALTWKDTDDATIRSVAMHGRDAPFSFKLDGSLLRLDVDPAFDVFRRLDRAEIPPALSRAFGSKEALVILPSKAPEDLKAAYEKLAASLGRTGPGGVQTALDSDLESLPSDRSVWILGWENRFFKDVPASLGDYDVTFGADELVVEKTLLPRKGHSFVATARHPASPEETLLWIALDDGDAAPGLARKLPHYHKYSYLAFEGKEPTNVAKGQWPVVGSPLTRFFTTGADAPRPAMGKIPPGRPLAELPPLFSADNMLQTIRVLSSDHMEGRGIGTGGIDRAADHIAGKFRESGLAPFREKEGADGFYQRWDHSSSDGETYGLANVIAMVEGSDPGLGPVVIGAHYDGLGYGTGALGADVRKGNRGLLHPGADDNGSGVAVMLAAARSFGKGWKPLRTVYFAAFTGEETGRLGSRYFVRSLAGDDRPAPFAMINVDTVGRLEGKRFLILGGSSASEWVHIFRGAGFLTGAEIQMVSEDLDASDQVSFIEAGIPAVQISTGPTADYHRPGDAVGTIDRQGLVKAASLLREVVDYLAGRAEGLTVKDSAGSHDQARAGKRRTSLGTVPDFGFGGPGVRLTGTIAGSPAEQAGLREGDIITALNGEVLAGLRDFSGFLKKTAAGSVVVITYIRGGEESEVEAVIQQR